MKIEVFKVRKVSENKIFLLGGGNLYEYLNGLNPNFFNFDIQRRIVDNTFLESIAQSVQNDIPFPAITLTSNSQPKEIDISELDLSQCEILDGLQRTFRLWAIYYVAQIIIKNPNRNYREIYEILKNDDYGRYIIKYNIVNRSKLNGYMTNHNGSLYIYELITAFKKYEVIFNVWYGLSDDEVVKQMLILNAGHKRVSNIHQFEIIYLHFFDKNLLQLPQGIRILREKDEDYKLIFNKEKRSTGMFALSSLMIAFQSYYMAKPLRVKGVNQINLEFENSDLPFKFSEILIAKPLSQFISILYDLDTRLSQDAGYWLSRDTSLSGIFAAIGCLVDQNQDYDDFTQLQKFITLLDTEKLNLKEYYTAYDQLSSTRINVGSVVRKAVFNGCLDLFTNLPNKIDWHKAFTER